MLGYVFEHKFALAVIFDIKAHLRHVHIVAVRGGGHNAEGCCRNYIVQEVAVWESRERVEKAAARRSQVDFLS